MEIGSGPWRALITKGAEAMNVPISTQATDQIGIHAVELIKWNRKINLTRITDPFEIAVKHFLDSIAAVNLIPAGARILDVGSGGGFPGIPLKILIPSLHLTLIDASRKKAHFLKHMIRTLGLDHTDAVHLRAEDMDRENGFTAGFDVVVSRALTSLPGIAKMSFPLLGPNGVTMVWKSVDQVAKLDVDSARHDPNAFQQLKGTDFSIKTIHYVLPYLNLKRAIVMMRPDSHLKTSSI
jgi:16S rRNA (guanine527-N7)-methyltransferase